MMEFQWIQGRSRRTAGQIGEQFPQAEWDYETRPDVFKRQKPAWHAVYIELEATQTHFPYMEAALYLLAKIRKAVKRADNQAPDIAIDWLSLSYLMLAAVSRAERFERFFVWRTAAAATQDIHRVSRHHIGPAEPDLSGPLPTYNADLVLELAEALLIDIKANPEDRDIVLDWIQSYTEDELVYSAVVDDQLGFAHERFRKSANETRFENLFVQRDAKFLQKNFAGIVTIGSLLTQTHINALIGNYDEDRIYKSLNTLGPIVFENVVEPRVQSWKTLLEFFRNNFLDPSFDRLRTFRASHGTHALDLAAGRPTAEGVDDRPIVAVDLVSIAAADTSGLRLEVYGILALMWLTVFSAPKKSLVITVSYALQAGAKDGSGFFERESKRMILNRDTREAKATWLVLPSGNGYREMGHANISTENQIDLEWVIQPGDLSTSWFEIWGDCNGTPPPGCLIVAPPGASPVEHRLDMVNTTSLVRDGRQDVARIYTRADIVTGRWKTFLALAPSRNYEHQDMQAPAGIWKLKFVADHGKTLDLFADVQRDDTPTGFPPFGRQSFLDSPDVDDLDHETGLRNLPYAGAAIRRGRTISSLATSHSSKLLVVGGAFEHDELATVALYSAAGPRNCEEHHCEHSELSMEDGTILMRNPNGVPHLAAVSEETRTHAGRLAAGMMSGSIGAFSGTSTAAPQIARKLVDMLEDVGPTLTRNAVVTALATSHQGEEPNRLGKGVLEFDVEPGRAKRRLRT